MKKAESIGRSQVMFIVLLLFILMTSACGGQQPEAGDAPAPAEETAVPADPTEEPEVAGEAEGEATAATGATEEPASEPASSGEGLAAEQVLRIGVNGSPSMLDPHRTNSVWDHIIIQQIYSGLLRYGWPSGQLEPDLATHWDISDDGLEYTFYLREGVQWHNGYGEFTANDVKYSIERVLDPESQSVFAVEFELVEEVEVIDDYTVKIVLSEPYVPLLDKVAALKQGFIVSEKVVEEMGNEALATTAIGTGPFILEQWDPNNEIILTANPDYYAGEPTLQTLVMRPILELTTLSVALESGDVDVIEVTDATTYQNFLANPNLTVKQAPSFSRVSLGLNTTVEPLDDVRVRQALAYAINLDEIVSTVLTDVAVRSYSVLGPLDFGYTDDLKIYDYDPEQARALLEEAGLADGFEVDIVYPESASQGVFHKAMTAIQAYWADIGVTVNIETPDAPTAIEMMSSGTIPMGFAGTSRPPEPDYNLTVYFDEDGAWNYIHYDDIQELLDEGRSETDPDARRAIYEEIQRKIAEDVPVIPLVIPINTIAMQNYVQGMEVDLYRGFWAYDTSIAEH